MEKQSKKIVVNAIPISNAANELLPQLINQETGLRGYLISGDEVFLEPYYSGRETLYSNLNEIKQYQDQHPIMKNLIEQEALPQIELMQTYFESQINLVQAGNLSGAQLRINNGKITMDQFRQIDLKIENDINKIIDDAWDRSNEAGERAKQVILFGAITALFVGLAFIYSFKWQRNQEKLKYLSAFDGLTDLFNRRSFDEQLTKTWTNAKQNQQSLSLLLIDIDSFKLYNDTYGHLQGDFCLKTIAEYIKKETPPPLSAYRYGGEEFAIIVPENNLFNAISFAELIRKGIEQLQLEHCEQIKDPFVTVSIGVETINTDFISTDELIQHADKALYQAKKLGRNRVIKYNEL